jgi:hypothetical protein
MPALSSAIIPPISQTTVSSQASTDRAAMPPAFAVLTESLAAKRLETIR